MIARVLNLLSAIGLVILFIVVAMSVSDLTYAATLPATAANLTALVGSALPGDTVVVTGDVPDRLTIKGSFNPPLTLDLTAATLEGGVYVNKGGGGVEIMGGLFRPTLPGSAIYVTGGAHVHARGITVQTAGTGYAVMCRDGGDVSLTGSTLNGAGIQLNTCQDVTIDGNVIAGFSSDGTQIAASQRVTYTHNLCWAGVNDGLHHPDCFQAGGVAGQPGNVDITVRWNEFYGPAQGADDFAGAGAPGVVRLNISDNSYVGSYPQAFAVGNSPGAIVRNNHARTLPGSPYRAAVNITAPNVDHCGNTADAYGRWAAWADAGCAPN